MKTFDIASRAFTYVGRYETTPCPLCIIVSSSDFKYQKQIKRKHDD